MLSLNLGKQLQESSTIAIQLLGNSLCILQLEYVGENTKVRYFQEIDLPEGAVENAVIQDPDAVAREVEKALSQPNPSIPNTDYVIWILGQEQVFLTVTDVPVLEPAQIDKYLKNNADTLIPMSLQEVYWDWEPLSHEIGKAAKQTIQLMSASRASIDSYLAVLKKLQLIPLSFEPAGSALNWLLQSTVNDRKNFICLELQEKSYNLCLYADNHLLFATQLNWEKVEYSEVTKLKFLKQKLNEVTQFASVYAEDLLNLAVLVYGNHPQFEEVLAQLRQETKLELLQFKLHDEVTKQLDRNTKRTIDDYYPLIGGAIHGLPNFEAVTGINLLPVQQQKQFAQISMLSEIRSYLIVILLNAILTLILFTNVSNQLQTELSLRQTDLQAVQNLSQGQRIEGLKTDIKSLNDATQLRVDILEAENDWLAFFDLLGVLLPPEVSVTNLQTEPSDEYFVITLSGRSDVREAIFEFSEALEQQEQVSE